MRIRRIGTVSLLVVLALALPGCKDAPAEEEVASDLATVEPIEGSDVSAGDALRGSGGSTRHRNGDRRGRRPDGRQGHDDPVRRGSVRPGRATRGPITNPAPLVFVRAPIDVIRIDGEQALLSQRTARRVPTW